MAWKRQSISDFTGYPAPKRAPEIDYDGPSLAKRMIVAVDAGVLVVAAIAKEAVEFGRDLVASVAEHDKQD